MKGFGEHKKSFNKISKESNIQNFQKLLINQAIQFHLKGNIPEATKCYKKIIDQGCKDYKVFANYGVILKNFGKLKEAEKSTRIAIELNPDYAMAYCNLGAILKDLGKLKEAEKSTRKAIELSPDIAEVQSNLGSILKNLGKLKEAEKSTRKAIELKPDYALAYCNLGGILKTLGKLKEAEKSTLKAIELDPNLASAYFSLSTLKYGKEIKIWKKQLFSENILMNKSNKDKINIYFARGNILHNEKKYQESSKYYTLANDLKLNFKPSQFEDRLKKSEALFIETGKSEIDKKESINFPKSVFIVGMPRSGSTLIESILSMNSDVHDLGEINILEESFLEHKQIDKESTLIEIYLKKISGYTNKFNITTNKWLYNYQYAGIIASQIPEAKIIHCFRNPLDNILSIYRSNFESGNEYSSSLVDCTRVYLDQEEIMSKYKDEFRSKIYDINYDLLVGNPKKEIKSLISWLGWHWDDSYLSPHLNTRTVSTASSVQVRSPINSKSMGGWKNYKDMLNPSIELLKETYKYRNLLS